MPDVNFGGLQNPNIIILMTDQQRAFRYFPENWIDANLPNFRQLQKNGMTFTNAICNASRCSPSRSVLYTGQYTWQTTVFDVGGTLPTDIPTIGQLMQTAGYEMVYKGKWHLTGDADDMNFINFSQTRPVDATKADSQNAYLAANYNIGSWTSPDAGTALVEYGSEPKTVPTSPPYQSNGFFSLGGSLIENDDRFVIGPSAAPDQQSAIDFLTQYQQSGSTSPFCLAVSLVNPHDVSVFPDSVQSMQYWNDEPVWQNYTGFTLPPSYTDTLQYKPAIQSWFVESTNGAAPFPADSPDLTPLMYMQFYAYLHTLPDNLFSQVLASMNQDLINNTIIIRLADHGEMAMSHGGMRYKDLNAYQETINVPLVFSNPVLFPKPVCVNQLVGLVDLMPTLATLVGLTEEQKETFQFKGIDFSSVLLDPTSPTQNCMLYTYDDDVPQLQSGDAGYIRTLVMTDYKFSVYYQTSGGTPTGTVEGSSFQYELYDLKSDPGECNNLLPVGGTATPNAQVLQIEFYNELTARMAATNISPNGWPSTLPSG